MFAALFTAFALAQAPCETLIDAEGTSWEVCESVLRRDGKEIRLDEGTPDGLFVANGTIWVEVVQRTAVPLGIASGQPTAVATAVPGESQGRQRVGAEILTVDGRSVVVGMGSNHGIRDGQVIGFYAFDDEESDRRHLEARGVVVSVGSSTAEVRLFLNQSTDVDAMAELLPRGKARGVLAPPTVRNVVEFDIEASAGIDTEGEGGFFGFRGNVGYRFRGPLRIDLSVDPMDVAFDTGAGVSTSLTAALSFDHQLFAIGLGGGVSIEQGGSRHWSGGEGAKPVLAGLLRFGAVDGWNVFLRAQLALVAGDWTVDMIEGGTSIPLSQGARPMWLSLRFRGGNGYNAGNLGIRLRVKGNGGGGTVHVMPFAGWKSIDMSFAYGPWVVGPEVGLRVNFLAGKKP